MKKNILLLVITILLVNIKVFAQFNADVDGQLVVSPMNGGASYIYPISNNSVDGFPLKVSLNYSGNVQMTAFQKYIYDDTTGIDGWQTLTKLQPAWILGVNGFAIEVLGHNSVFDPSINCYNGPSDYKHWLIPGYDYCNSMEQLTAEHDQDVIKLLREDGSVLELKNSTFKTQFNNVNDSLLYVGHYYIEGINNSTYAIVEYDSTYWPYFQKKQLKDYYINLQGQIIDSSDMTFPNKYKYIPRKVRLYNGDGLEYVFREHIAPYGTEYLKPIVEKNYLYYHLYPSTIFPTIFYLTEINSEIKNITKFKRTWHNFDNNVADASRGHAHIKEFSNHVIDIGDLEYAISTMGRTIKIKTLPMFLGWEDLSDEIIIQKNDIKKDLPANLLSTIDNDTINAPDKSNDYFTFLNYVTDIYDPMNRKTSFDYQKKKVFYSGINNYSYFTTYNVNKIEEPTKVIELQFKSGDNFLYLSELNNNNLANPDHIASVQTVDVFDKINSTKDQLLSKTIYDFQNFKDPANVNSYSKTVITKTLYPATEGSTTWDTLYYAKYETAPYNNSGISWRTPNIYDIYLYKTVNRIYRNDIGGLREIEEINFNQYDYSRGSVVTNKLNLLVGENYYFKCNNSYFWGNIPTFQTGKVIHKYEYDKVNSFGNNTGLSNQYGYTIKKKKDYIFDVKSNDTLFKNITIYRNLSDTIINVERIDSTWNPWSSKYYTYLNWRNGNIGTINQYNYHSVLQDMRIPPIYGIVDTVLTYDSQNNMLKGSRYEYVATHNYNQSNTLRRGALLKEYSISKKFNEEILVKEVSYKGGYSKNLVSEVKNTYGHKSKMYYSYADAGGYPIGKKLANTEDIFDVTFHKEQNEYEAVIANESFVRKTLPSDSIETLSFKTYNERTYFGQTSGVIDENGWLHRAEYDLNGRKIYNWEPFDFPPKPERLFSGDICDPIEDIAKSRIEFVDTIYNGDMVARTYQYNATNPSLYEDYDRTARVGNIYKSFVGDDSTNTGIYKGESHKLIFKYHASDFSPLKTSTEPITSLFLNLNFVGFDFGKSVTLTLKSTIQNYEATVVIGADYLKNLQNTPGYSNNGLIPLKFDMMPIVNSLINLPHGSIAEFELSTTTNDAYVDILTSSDDTKPKICPGEYVDLNKQDFTYKYQYNDNTREMVTYAKIDDYGHTSNKDWEMTGLGDGRYSGGRTFYRANNIGYKSELLIGNPLSTNIKRISQINVEGGGAITTTTDPLGYTSSVFKDGMGRSYKSINQDGTTKNVWEICYPDDGNYAQDDLSDQNFYGYVKFVMSKDENTNIDDWFKWLFSYYDAFGNLRRTVKSCDNGEQIVTKYEYNSIGQLIKVIDPNGAETKYWYDDWGRVKYKYNPDIGYISYAYDKMGNLRFTQNAMQSDSNKVGFLEYDDLGRQTITGEAIIDPKIHRSEEPELQTNGTMIFSRLTDFINPNLLNGKTDLFINPSLWNGIDSIITTPTIFSTNIPQISDYEEQVTLNDSLMMRQITGTNYNYKVATQYNFENIDLFPEFIRVSNLYDIIPDSIGKQSAGKIWNASPTYNQVNQLMPKWQAKNLKGRLSAVAYRNDEYSPFNYVFFSYDPRGRIEAMVRFTDNIGYDAVYYKYNSMNQIIKMKVADQLQQYNVWYDYDDNGRLRKVYAKIDKNKTGLGVDTLVYPPDTLKCPSEPEVEYEYNERGGVKTINYTGINAKKFFYYNSRGFIDSLVARRNINELIFKEELTRRDDGLITKQKSKSINSNAIETDYIYDEMKQLLNANGTNSNSSFTFDNVGNRLSSSENGLNITYNYHNILKNRLLSTINSNILSTFVYNLNGAVERIEEKNTLNNNLLAIREFDYYSGGLIKNFRKVKYNYVDDEQTDLHDIANWSWNYHYGFGGARESKRMIVTPYPESEKSKLWIYYLRGAGGEEIAMYQGRQTSLILGQESGKRVYFNLTNFYLEGGNIILRKDGTKEFYFKDHIGSTRVMLASSGGSKVYEYLPFGDTLYCTNHEAPRKGFAGEEFDFESDLVEMGARMYMPKLGRFLAPDPLWESFPSLTPYHFAYNNPISFHDNSGLAPEKEEGDRMLGGSEDPYIQESLNLAEAAMGHQFEAERDWRQIWRDLAFEIKGLSKDEAIEKLTRLGFSSFINANPIQEKPSTTSNGVPQYDGNGTLVDLNGKIIEMNTNSDNVFLKNTDGKIEFIGKKDGDIDISKIMKNWINKILNTGYLKLSDWIANIRTGGALDIKNREGYIFHKVSFLGRKYEGKNTHFIFKSIYGTINFGERSFDAPGNFLFGISGLANQDVFTEFGLKMGAGVYQHYSDLQIRDHFNNFQGNEISHGLFITAAFFPLTLPMLPYAYFLPSHMDNPTDQYWIERGFQYFHKRMKGGK